MPAVIVRIFCLCVALTAVCGCKGVYIHEREHKAAIESQQEYVKALERKNQELEAENSALRSLAGDAELVSKENEFYDQIARQIEKWLQAAQPDLTGIHWDAKEGKWTLQGDVLFASGSYDLSAKGGEVLRTLADAYSANNVHFRIVGHTDRDPIKKQTTKDRLHTDTQIELSAMRAVAVCQGLLKGGIAESRISVEGHGNNDPVAPNDDNGENKRKNRRVEIFILDGEPAK